MSREKGVDARSDSHMMRHPRGLPGGRGQGKTYYLPQRVVENSESTSYSIGKAYRLTVSVKESA
jgi:hypothetical protein